MTTAKPMRLSRSLVISAEKAGAIHKRTTPKQIEYWAEIGRSVERMINMDDILGVTHGLKKIKIEPFESLPVASKDIFDELEEYRSSGNLSKHVTSSKIYYEASIKHPGLLDKVNTVTGERNTGQFFNGKFEERV